MGSRESHGSISTAILTAIRGKRSRFIVCGVAVALLCWLPARPLIAAVFTVDSTIDATDAVPGDGLCDNGTRDIGRCSLREAILASNATSTVIDTIAFDIAGAGPHLIFDNQSLAIDLGTDGVTANDPGDGDAGANGADPAPVTFFQPALLRPTSPLSIPEPS